MKLLLVMIAMLAAVNSCQRMNHNQGNTSNNGNQQDNNRFENSVIAMKRTECFGTCPVDSISISGTGKVFYQGIRHTTKEGSFEKQLTEKEANTLFNKFECANFTDFQSEYAAPVSDVPTTYLTFKHRGFQKTIKDYYNAPQELKDLEKLVIEVIDSEGWTKLN